MTKPITEDALSQYNMGTASTDLIHASKQFISIKKINCIRRNHLELNIKPCGQDSFQSHPSEILPDIPSFVQNKVLR